MSDVMTERPLALPEDLYWEHSRPSYYLELKDDCVEITATFVPNNSTYAWYADDFTINGGKAGPEYIMDGTRAPKQILELWLAPEVFDKLSGDEIDRFVSLAVENEIRRAYAWNDFPGWYVEKRKR